PPHPPAPGQARAGGGSCGPGVKAVAQAWPTGPATGWFPQRLSPARAWRRSVSAGPHGWRDCRAARAADALAHPADPAARTAGGSADSRQDGAAGRRAMPCRPCERATSGGLRDTSCLWHIQVSTQFLEQELTRLTNTPAGGLIRDVQDLGDLGVGQL